MYHIYKKTVKSGNKMVQRWYYWYKDPKTGKQVSKVCKDCHTKQQALLYISQLPAVADSSSFLIKDIAKDMFVPGSSYSVLCESLGKKYTRKTRLIHLQRLKNVLSDFGNFDLRDITPKGVIECLSVKPKSSSWKNQYLHTLHEIFLFANYNGAKIFVPKFPRFTNTAKKSDVFTPEEIARLFSGDNFSSETFYLLLLLTFSAGLRSGEARAFRPCQIHNEKQVIIIDGFLDELLNRTNYNKTGNNENLKWRAVPLPTFVFEKLKAFVEKTGCKPNDLLFTYSGAPVTQGKAIAELRDAMAKAGIKPNGRKLTCHSLRYTYVTYMRSFLPGEDVRKFVGHSNIEMTEYYTRAALEASIMAMSERYGVVNKFFTELTHGN